MDNNKFRMWMWEYCSMSLFCLGRVSSKLETIYKLLRLQYYPIVQFRDRNTRTPNTKIQKYSDQLRELPKIQNIFPSLKKVSQNHSLSKRANLQSFDDQVRFCLFWVSTIQQPAGFRTHPTLLITSE